MPTPVILRGEDIVLVPLHQHLGAHRARELHPERGRDGEDQRRDGEKVMLGAVEQCERDAVDEERDEDRRQAELNVGDPHDDRIDDAAEIAAQEAEATPTSAASATLPKPTASDVRRPYIMAESRSRPCGSVPSR